MTFENNKKQTLDKLDKSKKGFVDEEILELVNHINSLKDFYTTSSCAGRISLTQLSNSGRKNETEWFFVSHKIINIDQINFNNIPKEKVYFKLESSIIHIACRTLEDANNLINIAKDAGYKRAHLTSIKKNIVEIMDSLKIEAPISKDNALLVSKEYIELLIQEANEKLEITRKKINKLLTLLKQQSLQ